MGVQVNVCNVYVENRAFRPLYYLEQSWVRRRDA